MTEAALAAKSIRKELKEAFPTIVFHVMSETFTGGDAVRVSYINGVPTSEVEKAIECSNSRDVKRVKYLFVTRELSEDIEAKVQAEFIKIWGLDANVSLHKQRIDDEWAYRIFQRKTSNMSF